MAKELRKLYHNGTLFYPVTDASAVIYDNSNRTSVFDAVSTIKTVSFFGPSSNVIVEDLDTFHSRGLDDDEYVAYWLGNKDIAYARTSSAGDAPEVTSLVTAFYRNGGWYLHYTSADLMQFESFSDLVDVANGKTKSKVFATKAAMESFLKTAPTDETRLNVGDVLLIIDTDVPDYWISEVKSSADAQGYYYGFSKLETQKVVLDDYYTKEETDEKFLGKDNSGVYTVYNTSIDVTDRSQDNTLITDGYVRVLHDTLADGGSLGETKVSAGKITFKELASGESASTAELTIEKIEKLDELGQYTTEVVTDIFE